MSEQHFDSVDARDDQPRDDFAASLDGREDPSDPASATQRLRGLGRTFKERGASLGVAGVQRARSSAQDAGNDVRQRMDSLLSAHRLHENSGTGKEPSSPLFAGQGDTPERGLPPTLFFGASERRTGSVPAPEISAVPASLETSPKRTVAPAKLARQGIHVAARSLADVADTAASAGAAGRRAVAQHRQATPLEGGADKQQRRIEAERQRLEYRRSQAELKQQRWEFSASQKHAAKLQKRDVRHGQRLESHEDNLRRRIERYDLLAGTAARTWELYAAAVLGLVATGLIAFALSKALGQPLAQVNQIAGSAVSNHAQSGQSPIPLVQDVQALLASVLAFFQSSARMLMLAVAGVCAVAVIQGGLFAWRTSAGRGHARWMLLFLIASWLPLQELTGGLGWAAIGCGGLAVALSFLPRPNRWLQRHAYRKQIDRWSLKLEELQRARRMVTQQSVGADVLSAEPDRNPVGSPQPSGSVWGAGA